VLQQALGPVRWLARATGWLAWLLSPSSRKARVRSEAPGIRQAWFTSQAAESLQKLLAGLGQTLQAATEPDSAVSAQWRRSSPSLLALQEQLLATKGTTEEQDILRRGLATRFSPELVNRIQSIV